MEVWPDFDLCSMNAAEDAFFVLLFTAAGILLGFILAWAGRRFGYLDRVISPTLTGASFGCLAPAVLGIFVGGLAMEPWRRFLSPDACGGAFTPSGIALAFYVWLTPLFAIGTLWWIAYRSSK